MLSHRHAPATQRVPTPHAGPLPHAHSPPVQRSAEAFGHDAHARPRLPQLAAELARHTLPSQHPPAHDVALHTHAPFTHARPGPHGACTPHAQLPAVQRSVFTVAQLAQIAPAVPQRKSVGVWHAPLKQQPEGHVLGSQPLHVPPSQRDAGGQV